MDLLFGLHHSLESPLCYSTNAPAVSVPKHLPSAQISQGENESTAASATAPEQDCDRCLRRARGLGVLPHRAVESRQRWLLSKRRSACWCRRPRQGEATLLKYFL